MRQRIQVDLSRLAVKASFFSQNVKKAMGGGLPGVN
jgi:hypothetical protein